MKRLFLLLSATALTVCVTWAQDARSPFRKGYTRLGLQLPGNRLDNTLSPKENILKGNLGNDQGYTLETGRLFYFLPASSVNLFNVGLDWTIFSATFTPTTKSWDNYADKTTGYSKEDFSTKLMASVATKLGPVLSINPVQDLIIDVRAQASLGVYAIGPVYESFDNTEGIDGPTNAFYTFPNDPEASGAKSVTQGFNTLLKPNIGATVRWRGIGLAADYSPGKLNMKYKAIDNGVESTGEQKVPLNTFQLKLSFQGKK